MSKAAWPAPALVGSYVNLEAAKNPSEHNCPGCGFFRSFRTSQVAGLYFLTMAGSTPRWNASVSEIGAGLCLEAPR